MRPALIIPFLGHAAELRACVTSIDIPVRLVVIDNTTRSVALDAVPDDAWVVEPPGNLGYGASVNLAIKALPHEPYWLVANHDVVFAPGDLQRLTEDPRAWVGVNDWRVFKLTAEAVLCVGYWDESFHPAYCEDADYERRCTLAGIPWGFIEGNTSHVGSIVLREHRADNDRSYPANVHHYIAKWGVGVRMPGGYATPFDRGGSVADGTMGDLSILRANAWRRPDR